MNGFNEIDYGIMAIVGVSVVFGLLRGFVREAMSLMTWILAGILGTLYCDEVAAWFTSISIVGVRLLLAFILIVLTTLIVGGIVSHLISKLVKSTKFSITDRIVGTLFGLARGVVIIAIVVLMVNPSVVAKKEIWKSSKLVPQFEPASLWIKAQLPEELLKFYENPYQNSDQIKKTLEKANDTTQEPVKAVEKPMREINPIDNNMPLENIEPEQIGTVEDLTDNALTD